MKMAWHNCTTLGNLDKASGFANNPQDPQVTLGEELSPISTLPVAIERLYASIKNRDFQIVFGKNYYPFKKYHEMYWSDWINPNGISFRYNVMNVMELRSLFAVIQSNGLSFDKDAFMFGVQLPFVFEDPETKLKVEHNQTFHYFNEIPVLPFGLPSGRYSPFFYYLSVKISQPTRKGEVYVLSEAFLELKKLSPMDTLLEGFDNERTGGCLKFGYEHETRRAHWETSLNYTYMPKYSAVDYFAQNDWARWNYRSMGSPVSNLTNIQGIEFVFKYWHSEKINITMKYFNTSRIKAEGPVRENNDRLRVDLNIKI